MVKITNNKTQLAMRSTKNDVSHFYINYQQRGFVLDEFFSQETRSSI